MVIIKNLWAFFLFVVLCVPSIILSSDDSSIQSPNAQEYHLVQEEVVETQQNDLSSDDLHINAQAFNSNARVYEFAKAIKVQQDVMQEQLEIIEALESKLSYVVDELNHTKYILEKIQFESEEKSKKLVHVFNLLKTKEEIIKIKEDIIKAQQDMISRETQQGWRRHHELCKLIEGMFNNINNSQSGSDNNK